MTPQKPQDQDYPVEKVEIPVMMKEWAEERGLEKLEMHSSPVALSLEARWTPTSSSTEGSGQEEGIDALRDTIARLVQAARGATRRLALNLPIVVILDLNGDEAGRDDRRRILDRLARDQEWHRGEFGLYVASDLAKLSTGSHPGKRGKALTDREAGRDLLLREDISSAQVERGQSFGLERLAVLLEGAVVYEDSDDPDPVKTVVAELREGTKRATRRTKRADGPPDLAWPLKRWLAEGRSR